jgi:hypothetical protein
MVYSLQWSAREALGNIALLNEIDKMSSRVDDLRQPVGDDEIIYVVKRRLLKQEPEAKNAADVAQVYQEAVTKQRRAAATSALEQDQVDQEGARLRDQIRLSFPSGNYRYNARQMGSRRSFPTDSRRAPFSRFIAARSQEIRSGSPAFRTR